ncbi:hypothetical protein F2Q69_00054880 [Brassica cretica]|uniref:Uncharacterized protein n=1 Tax=Brassica cretica TaxID=69181 RepID=A0A8S9MZ30_BRACR|nr:hypothetical protein F2Q69_00054880 [Brassica cretica]
MSPLILVLASRQTRLPQPPKTKAADPASDHYILSFDANTMIILDGEYFVKCEVVGPLQGKERIIGSSRSISEAEIRKMIGVSVAFMRNYAPESLIQTSFNSCTLKLDYTLMNVSSLLITKDLKGSHEELSMEEYKEVAEARAGKKTQIRRTEPNPIRKSSTKPEPKLIKIVTGSL